jgi:hypothetical protein
MDDIDKYSILGLIFGPLKDEIAESVSLHQVKRTI